MIPDSSWKTVYAKRSIEPAHLSIVLVASYIFPNCQTRALADRIFDAWPVLWAWIRFLLVNIDESDGESLRPTTAMLECLGRTTDALGHNQRFHRIIHTLSDTPGFVETVTREWLEERERGKRRTRSERDKLDDLLTRGFFTLLWIGLLEKQTPYKEILEAANGPTNPVLTAVRHVQFRLDQKHGATAVLGFDLTIVLYIGGHDDKPLHDEMLAAGSTRLAVRCLFVLDQSTAADHQHASNCATICYLFLREACKRRADGHLYVRQALGAGLLSVIPRTWKLLRLEEHLDILHDLLDKITPYLYTCLSLDRSN